MLLSSQPVDCCYYKIRTFLLLTPLACIRQHWYCKMTLLLPPIVGCCYSNNKILLPLLPLADADLMLLSSHPVSCCDYIKKLCCHYHRLHALANTNTARWCCCCRRRLFVAKNFLPLSPLACPLADADLLLLSSQPVDCCYYINRIFLPLSPLACDCHDDAVAIACQLIVVIIIDFVLSLSPLASTCQCWFPKMKLLLSPLVDCCYYCT